MSVREEDKQKSSCSGRGLGLAAAAIGVGVGAALYYFLSKRPENPDTEGATSAGWYEQQQTFRKRAWSLEQCSVCFEVMLQDQQLMSLPCTHNFHVGCIGPWLEQQQTCPVCRKPVE